ncbi:class I SAM-dependent methyltransferase [Actinomadura sp. HBU206391]|uniref:class I SAM-dependent methyltransferase n=1 Tax=Actinomadura sp. HBU206391 TaxID=2731692 RepID=UPI00164FD149|nr:class I SAM-dependent methyltransferase [Actinomadura sp. HBU206391]MBC6458763.1 class I SAM-dependent methyltransferase [Actinomadura sp. HBU206391]
MRSRRKDLAVFRDAVLAGCDAVPGCERIAVPIDPRERWAIEPVTVGFDRAAPTAWLAEGLLAASYGRRAPG